MPATSPTLSPTLSAMTAGLRGRLQNACFDFAHQVGTDVSSRCKCLPHPGKEGNGAGSQAKTVDDICIPENDIENADTQRPKPTITMPVTAPPEKAMVSAGFIPELAAWAVRVFALVAMRIPTLPARAENTAPTIKQTAV